MQRVLLIEDLMTKEVETCEPDTGVVDVARRMHEHRISCLLVCEDGIPIGMISERDLVRVLVAWEGGAGLQGASDLMSSPVVTIPQSTPLSLAVAETKARQIRHLPVVDAEGALVGIVTQTDLLRAHARELEQLVHERTLALAEANERLELLALQDSLLSIGNRRAMEMALDQAHATALRHDRQYAIAIFDVDHFKAYNDCYGHLAGDGILRRIADMLRETLRGTDSLYRYGGEEILVILVESDVEGARQFAERARRAVEAAEISHSGIEAGRLTVSCGVGGCSDGTVPDSCWHVVRQADRALTSAKRGGRNQVAVLPPED